MPYTIDVDIDENVIPFLEKEVAPECEWAVKPDIMGGYVNDLVGFILGEEEVDSDRNVEASVSFVSKDKIHELNSKFRNIDSPTDVLSFPCDNPAETEDELVELGDIIISPEIANKQAAEYGNTYIEEISLLITHGVLHLLGYDHVEDDEAEKMEARERELREAWERIK
ncbi:MAG: rRNA maturation RNase YbeY [Coriobacteriales bacterium]|jgi:probable rRNA maturation factor